MANYNKYINTFSGSTDVQEWGAYIGSEYAGFPNVAYLETSDMVKYRKTGTAKEAVGSIYYSDGSMTSPSEDVDTTKTPIGIVAIPALNDYSVQLGYNTIICSLFDTTSGGTNSVGANYNTNWTASSVDTSLPSIAPGQDLTNVQNFDGKYNTSVLAASGSTCPAAYGCSLYSTEGTAVGDWYLPTSAELLIAFSGGTSGNTTIINNTISKIRTALGNNAAYTIGSNWYWSSTGYKSGIWYGKYVGAFNGVVDVANQYLRPLVRAFYRIS